MLTVDSIHTGNRYNVITIDKENGDPLIQNDDGDYVLVSRYHATTPIERCERCHKPLEFRTALKVADANKATCPDAEYHMYEQYWRAAQNPELNRAQRRRLEKQRDIWLTKHLTIKRGRQHKSNAVSVDSTIA